MHWFVEVEWQGVKMKEIAVGRLQVWVLESSE